MKREFEIAECGALDTEKHAHPEDCASDKRCVLKQLHTIPHECACGLTWPMVLP